MYSGGVVEVCSPGEVLKRLHKHCMEWKVNVPHLSSSLSLFFLFFFFNALKQQTVNRFTETRAGNSQNANERTDLDLKCSNRATWHESHWHTETRRTKQASRKALKIKQMCSSPNTCVYMRLEETSESELTDLFWPPWAENQQAQRLRLCGNMTTTSYFLLLLILWNRDPKLGYMTHRGSAVVLQGRWSNMTMTITLYY